MITQHFNIKLFDHYSEAPAYKEDVTLLKIDTCLIIGKGTEAGNPAVDIQMTDKEGNKFLVMTTGQLIELLGKACEGKRLHDELLKVKH